LLKKCFGGEEFRSWSCGVFIIEARKIGKFGDAIAPNFVEAKDVDITFAILLLLKSLFQSRLNQ